MQFPKAVLSAIALAGTLLLSTGTARADQSILTLGDSVVFGYITLDGPAYVNAANFVGYPDYLGMKMDADIVNASCPGETTAGFLSLSGVDNGCRGYRSFAPLHVKYTGTQLDFATAYLKKNRHVRLVTLSLGANDGFVFIRSCGGDPACIQNGLPGLLNTIGTNLAKILQELRATGYRGPIIVPNYYSTNYADAAGTGLTVALNSAMGPAAAAYNAVIADVFSAFQAASASAPHVPGNTCFAGLLNGNPVDPTSSTCDVHPSQSGQRLIARTVRATYEANH